MFDQSLDTALAVGMSQSSYVAISHLQLAVDRGVRNFVWMKIHVDLAPLAGEPRFQALLANGFKP